MDRKYKKTAWATAGMMLMASLPAFAAGLGKLTVTSTLGQPFRGEIELLAVDKKDLGSLRATFASHEAFKEARIERSPVLSGMRFSVEQKKSGEPYLKITSSKPVEEPFLDMLIELDWPSGRLVREYTVLLDPPGYGESQAAAPVAPPVGKAAAAKADETPAAMQPEIRASIPLDQKLLGKGEKKAAAEGQVSGDEYGPVKKGQNLAGIAAQVKPEGVSLEQMLVALFQTNKQAFIGNNMNRLKAGQILRLPEADKINEIEQKAAAKEVRVQAADWHAYRQKLAAAVAEAKPAEAETKQAASGKITTAVEDKAAGAKEPAKDVLKLSKSETLGGAKAGAAAPGTAAGAGGKDLQAMKDQLHAMQEEATAKDKAIKEANQRISDLEKNIKEMQKLLELKNQNLADLQKQAEVAKAAPAPAPAPAPAAAKPEATPAAPVAEQKAAEAKPAAPAPAAEKPADKPKKPKIVVAETPKEEPSLLDGLLENPLYLGGGVLALLLAGLLGAKGLAARRKKNIASFEDSIMTNGDLKANTVLGGTSGGKIDTSDTSFLTDFSQAGLGSIDTNEVDPIAEAEVYMAYGRDAQAEEILKEAMTKDPVRQEIRLKLLEIYAGRKNLNAFEAVAGEMYASLGGKGSPVWDKAAELGRSLDPQNPLYAEQAKAAPAAAAPAAAPEDMFEKTMIVAGGAAGVVAAAEHGVTLDLGAPQEEEVESAAPDLDFNLDLGASTVEAKPEAAAEAGKPAEEAASDLGFDFDLSALAGSPAPAAETAAPAPAAEEKTEEPAETALDFNLDLGAISTPAPAAEEVKAAPAPEPEQESALEFDLAAFTQPAPAAEPAPAPAAEEQISAESWKDEVMSLGEVTAAPAPAEAAPSLEIEIPSFTQAAPSGAEEAIELASPPAEEASLDFDFNLGHEEEVAAAPAPAESAIPDLDLSGISLDMGGGAEPVAAAPADFGSQEVSTKLDLARAYVDMGDMEGAREILNEVIREGGAEQQAEAKKLLSELG